MGSMVWYLVAFLAGVLTGWLVTLNNTRRAAELHRMASERLEQALDLLHEARKMVRDKDRSP